MIPRKWDTMSLQRYYNHDIMTLLITNILTMKKSESVLKSVKAKIEVKLPKKYEPTEFFKNRDGLYAWNSFKENVLEKAKAATVNSFSLSSFDLTKDAYDKEIEKELPKKHIFTETEVCAVIAGLIEKQSKGEEGTLLNTGYANIFYTKSHVVSVYWRSVFGEWCVGGWRRDGHSWFEGFRVFSPATEA